jgi:hypothetical protein
MKKTCYVKKAIAAEDPRDVYLECMEDVKAHVGQMMGERYFLIDLPIIIAGLKLLISALEQHPAVGESGRELIAHILDNVRVVDTSGLADFGRRAEEE